MHIFINNNKEQYITLLEAAVTRLDLFLFRLRFASSSFFLEIISLDLSFDDIIFLLALSLSCINVCCLVVMSDVDSVVASVSLSLC